MAGLNSPEFNSAMKILYIDPLNDLVVRKRVLLSRMEQNTKDISGEHAYVPLISARNPAVGSRKDSAAGASNVGAKLPDIGRQTYTQATYKIGLHYGRGAVSGAVIRRSRNNQGAFTRALDEEMQGLMKSLPDDLNRQICGMGDGRAATLSTNTAVAASTTTIIEVHAHDNMQARVGDRVNFSLVSTTSGAWAAVGSTSLTIAGINFFTDRSGNSSTNRHQITLSAAINNATAIGTTTHALYFGNASSGMGFEDSSKGQDIYGIQALIDNGNIGARYPLGESGYQRWAGEIFDGSNATIGGINRASNPFWQANVKQNPSSAGTLRLPDENIIQEAWLQATGENNADPMDIEIYSGVALWGTVGMTQVGSRIYNDNQDTVEMGFRYININGAKYFFDRDLPNHTMYFLSMKNIMMFTQNGYEFIADDGRTVRQIAGGGRDAWEFSVNRDVQTGINDARSHVALTDLKTTMTVQGQLH